MIILDENYSIEKDSFGWILNYRKEGGINPKTQKPTITKWQKYFGTFHQALLRYMDEALAPSASAKELLMRINMVENKILNIKIK